MSVILRKRKCADGKKSLYLDIWHNNKREYEFLKIYIKRAKTPEQAETNRVSMETAERIRANRLIELQARGTKYIPKFKKNMNFIAYYEKFVSEYKNKDVRLVRSSHNHFKKFVEVKKYDKIQIRDLSHELCKEFKDYLDEHLNGETPHNYFQKFKIVIKKLYSKEKLIDDNFTEGIKNSKSEGVKKDILNIKEINILAQAHCPNENVKRAFIFSLSTGLRFVDVKALKWGNIQNNSLRIIQKKVEKSKSAELIMELNKTAKRVAGEQGKNDEVVFILPSHNACLKNLKAWVKNAGINKHITWHCARHSFAVNLLDKKVVGTDINTVSSLLGHSGIKDTMKYLHKLRERENEAVNSLPEVEF